MAEKWRYENAKPVYGARDVFRLYIQAGVCQLATRQVAKCFIALRNRRGMQQMPLVTLRAITV